MPVCRLRGVLCECVEVVFVHVLCVLVCVLLFACCCVICVCTSVRVCVFLFLCCIWVVVCFYDFKKLQ